MDGPWGYFNGAVCVPNGQSVTVPVDGGSLLSNDVDDFKAVAWWYDPAFDTGAAMRNVDLEVREIGGSVIRRSDSLYDNKEMVQYTDAGNQRLELKFSSYATASSGTGPCGNGSTHVYFAYVFEDGDREAAEDLDGIWRW